MFLLPRVYLINTIVGSFFTFHTHFDLFDCKRQAQAVNIGNNHWIGYVLSDSHQWIVREYINRQRRLQPNKYFPNKISNEQLHSIRDFSKMPISFRVRHTCTYSPQFHRSMSSIIRSNASLLYVEVASAWSNKIIRQNVRKQQLCCILLNICCSYLRSYWFGGFFPYKKKAAR